MIPVFVPTRGRPDVEPIVPGATLVVDEDEVSLYGDDRRVVVCPAGMHIGQKRQWMIENLPLPHVQLDDDVRLTSLDGSSIDQLLDEMSELIKEPGATLVGVGQVYLGHIKFAKSRVHRGEPCYMMFAVSELMRGVDLSHYPLYEDTKLSIEAMLRGHTSTVYSHLVSNRARKDGGCSYKTPEMILETQDRLVGDYPDYVSAPSTEYQAHTMNVGRTLYTSWKGLRERRPPRSLPTRIKKRVLEDRRTVTLLVDSNPKQPGSMAYARFQMYFTVENPISAQVLRNLGITATDLNWDAERNFIDIQPRTFIEGRK